MKKVLILFFTVLLVSTTSVYAELHDRGGGLIYDDVLEVTWLQDANYAMTSGYDNDGRMTWNEAMDWADQLEYGGYSDWKLPQTLPINGSEYDLIGFNPNGSKDRGYNVSAPGSVYSGSTASQMAFMYYNSLENLARVDIYGNYPQDNWGLKNTAPFINIQSVQSIGYWSSTDDPHLPGTAFTFDFNDGWQFSYYKEASTLYAWAVRAGDSSPIPPPSPVNIDIKPFSWRNLINRRGRGFIPVAILSDGDFDATSQVDRTSLTFGRTGEEDSFVRCLSWGIDVDRNGYRDLFCFFRNNQTGFQCGDEEGFLKGHTIDEVPIEGSDSVRIVPSACKDKKKTKAAKKK